jgi:CheY-like chemotaxis protein
MKGKTGIQGRILILDDDPLTAQTIDRIARFIGMQAQYTTDHRIFFERLEDWHPDVIALDLVMPDMDGIEVLSVLAEQGCRADIIITSGVEQRVMESARRAADDKGLRILGLLAKPFSTGQLKELLNQHDAAVAERQVTDYVPVQTSESTQFPVLTEDTLTAAIVKRQFCYFYQPKVHCNTGVVCGFEALARWHHPEFGWQSPGRFIPEAESLGMISSLSSHLFAQGISWFAGLREQIASQSITMDFMLDFEQLTLSLNVSALSLAEFSLFTELRALCSQWNINTEQVILEITESCAMDDNERSLQTLTRLRMQGFQLAIDPFPECFSSLFG